MAGQLYTEIDRLVLKVSPIVLGRGLPMFAEPTSQPQAFTPSAHTYFDNGVRVVTYDREPSSS